MQSPGWTPEFTRKGRDILYKEFLKLAGCESGGSACLRAAESSVLQRASGALTKAAEAGEYGPYQGLFPVTDGDILPDSLPNRFRDNKFHSEVTQIITSNARWEAGVGTFPIANQSTDADFEALIKRQYTTDETLVKKILSLYPAQIPTNGYSSGFLRTRDFIGDVLFNCNGYYAASAYNRRSFFYTARKYIFNIPPSSHGGDLNYNDYGVTANSPFLELLAPLLGNLPPGTGLGGGASDSVLQGITRPDLAQEHQKWITDFIVKGTVRKDWPYWKKDQPKALWMNDTATGFGVADDYFKEKYRQKRCDVLRDEIYDKAK